jgi:hypothetical protein
MIWAAGRAVRYTPSSTVGFPHGGKVASCGRSLPPVSNPPLSVRGAAAIPAAKLKPLFPKLFPLIVSVYICIPFI